MGDFFFFVGIGMVYQEYLVFVLLCGYFGQLWQSQFFVDVDGYIIVLFDGCVDIFWCDGVLFVVGLDCVVVYLVLVFGVQVLGVCFCFGQVLVVLGFFLVGIIGQVVLLVDLKGMWVKKVVVFIGDIVFVLCLQWMVYCLQQYMGVFVFDILVQCVYVLFWLFVVGDVMLDMLVVYLSLSLCSL